LRQNRTKKTENLFRGPGKTVGYCRAMSSGPVWFPAGDLTANSLLSTPGKHLNLVIENSRQPLMGEVRIWATAGPDFPDLQSFCGGVQRGTPFLLRIGQIIYSTREKKKPPCMWSLFTASSARHTAVESERFRASRFIGLKCSISGPLSDVAHLENSKSFAATRFPRET